MKVVHTYEDLRKLQLRVKKLRAARLLTAVHTDSSTTQEIAQKTLSQFKPIFQLIKGLKQDLEGDPANEIGITKAHYLEFRKLVATLCEIGESLATLEYFRDKALESLVTATLDLSFITSAEIKLKGYAAHKVKTTEDELKRALSINGMKATHKRLL
jgi:hypothetical protein